MKQKKMNRHRKRLIKRLAAVGVAALVLVSTVSANSASYVFASDTSETVVDESESEEFVAEDVQEAAEEADAEVVEEADEAEDIIVGEVLEDAEISEEAAEAETEETETVETEEADAEEEDAEVSAACIVPETTKPDTDTKDDTCEEPEKTCEAIEFDLAAYLTGTCTLTGTETNKEALALLGGSTFSFVATDVDGNKVATGLATPTTLNGWCDSITWTGSKLKYTKAGTYCYTIKQVIGCYPAVNYDTACYTLTVVVKNVCGVLTCCPTLTKCGVTVKCPTFKNCYNPESVTVNFDVTKILDGRYLIDGEFSFKLYQYASLTNLVNLECISKATAVTNVNGGAVFSKTYKSCGIYYYALTEEKPTDAFDTMTYDTTVYYIKVVVIQGKDGKLQAYPYYSTDCGPVKCWKCLKTGSLTFTNTYRDTETIELTATKTLTGRDLVAGEFTFELTDEEGNTVTAVNDADGTISFGEFTYDQSDIGKTYTYTVEEVAGDLDGVTYDAEAKTITVEITYNEESGQIEAAVTSDEVLFENTYEPSSDPEDPEPDPEPEPDPTTPEDPEPDPTEPVDPDPEPTDPEDPEPEEPVEDDPVDPTKTIDVGDGEIVVAGETYTYTISYYNNEGTEATVIIEDELSEDVTYVSSSDDGLYDEDTHTVIWTLEDVAAYTEGEVTLTIEINEDATGILANTASVQIGESDPVDTNTVENEIDEDDDDAIDAGDDGDDNDSTATDTTSTAAKTGDVSNFTLYLILMAVAAVALVAVLVGRRVREENKYFD